MRQRQAIDAARRARERAFGARETFYINVSTVLFERKRKTYGKDISLENHNPYPMVDIRTILDKVLREMHNRRQSRGVVAALRVQLDAADDDFHGALGVHYWHCVKLVEQGIGG